MVDGIAKNNWRVQGKTFTLWGMFKPYEWMIAFRYLRAKRKEGFVSVIAIFSLLGIMLGVATLIIVMAVMDGFRKELLDRILGINAHVVLTDFGKPIEDFESLAKRIGKVEGVTSIVPIIEGQVMASANGESTGAQVRGLRPTDLMAKPLIAGHIVAGSLKEFYGMDRVAIGSRMARQMGLEVGDKITLIAPKMKETVIGSIPRIKEYSVVAVFDVGMFEYDSSMVFMPLPAAQLYFKYPHSVNGLEIMVSDANQAPDLVPDIMVASKSDYFVVDWQRSNAHFFNSLKVERNVMFLILTLIIVVAAFNIISSMIMLVRDKERSIAILRTMGATPGAIMRIFFMAGSTIGVLGTLWGFLLGVSFSLNIETIRQTLEKLTHTELFAAEIYFLSQLPAVVEIEDVVAVVGMALLLSFLATLYPAWRASRISPAEGVRYE